MISLRVFIFTSAILVQLAISQNCYIINKAAVKPYPSLIQCYKNNPSACCNSLADEYIKGKYDDLLSTSCQRSYPWLETYFCLACSPNEPTATNHTTKQIRLCSSFVDNLWAADRSQSSAVFDSCGMSTIWETNLTVVLPSEAFTSALDFVSKVKPPFFEDYTITIVDDSLGNCYSGTNTIQISFVVLSALLLFLFGL